MSRLDAVKAMVEQAPGDSRVRFMLCMEYLGAERWEDALAELDELVKRDPDYVTAYYQGGRANEQMGREDEARAWYQRGVETAKRIGDGHALSELQAALDILG
ncbi:MAG: tetratricopeptide repeat protein [Bryobacteraceae bacterium]|nr:tetratricopeptide repeat protein [Solibacteraceae bacterium]MCL4842011.1 tetratricopeptide repeat protein [Bryobacteraceae bacterium]MCO5351285.1 tetratricopeptide repeat protein [Bryobacteraceae bacterium]